MDLGTRNERIVVLSADLCESTRVKAFAERFPERFINVGVAEQNMASVAAGLALAGKIPVMTSFGVFSPGRNWDQIRVSIAYNKANVKIVSTHAGLTVGPDGATHQALEDIALMRVLPNMAVLSPVDYYETKRALGLALEIDGPIYLRLTRAKTDTLLDKQEKLDLGTINVLEDGSRVAIVGTGPILTEGLQAAKTINDKYPGMVKVMGCPIIKPLNAEKLLAELKGIEKIFTLEEHQIAGGFGSLVCEVLSERSPRQVTRIGMQNSFGESGSYEELKKKYKLNAENIREQVLEELKL